MGTFTLQSLIDFLRKYKAAHLTADKQEIQAVASEQFGLTKKRSVYVGPSFALRFCAASQASFSNTVVGLSTLKEYDAKPFVVSVVRPNELEFLLANSTLLKKISHSSHQLRVDNIRGSFLGHDIQREYGGVLNEPANFEKLFALHQKLGWAENLKRLVNATNAIAPTGRRQVFTSSARQNILAAPQVAAGLSGRDDYEAVEAELAALIKPNRAAILKAAAVDNVNLRGNLIEQILTKAANFHSLQDMIRSLRDGTSLTIDIKTKLLNLSSSPKGYNVDKTLEMFALGSTAFSYFFVGIDIARGEISTKLISILDSNIIDATRIQFHWAGRDSRGVTQLTGDLSWAFDANYKEAIDVPKGRSFLEGLIGSLEV
jgi:hypothetical protein